jgi:hypothetical protein
LPAEYEWRDESLTAHPRTEIVAVEFGNRFVSTTVRVQGLRSSASRLWMLQSLHG